MKDHNLSFSVSWYLKLHTGASLSLLLFAFYWLRSCHFQSSSCWSENFWADFFISTSHLPLFASSSHALFVCFLKYFEYSMSGVFLHVKHIKLHYSIFKMCEIYSWSLLATLIGLLIILWNIITLHILYGSLCRKVKVFISLLLLYKITLSAHFHWLQYYFYY